MSAADEDFFWMKDTGGTDGVQDDGAKTFRPRRVSYVAQALVLASLLPVLAALLSWLLTDRITLEAELPAPSLFLLLAGSLVALAGVWEAVSRFRRYPPPAWRVRQELVCALVDARLLPPCREEWQRRGFKAGFPRYDRASGTLRMRFALRHLNATEERMKRVANAACFRYAQGATIELSHDKRERANGWVLAVQYRTDEEAYSNALRKVKR